jgi:hypothetical protein
MKDFASDKVTNSKRSAERTYCNIVGKDLLKNIFVETIIRKTAMLSICIKYVRSSAKLII